MLLAIDTSSLVLSCALVEEGKLVAEWTQQKKLTHSEQLIPCMDLMLKEVVVSKKEITGIAVAKGPGSFTAFESPCYSQDGILYLERPAGRC